MIIVHYNIIGIAWKGEIQYDIISYGWQNDWALAKGKVAEYGYGHIPEADHIKFNETDYDIYRPFDFNNIRY